MHISLASRIAASLAATLLSTAAFAQEWGYEGTGAPENWGKLDPKFAICATGRNQSPIDLDNMIEAKLKPLGFKYKSGATEIVHMGHTVQANFAPGNALTVDGRDFDLVQFHFHAPGENRIGGKSFPLEAHLVHSDKAGNLAVVAVMFTAGAANPTLAKLWEKMPAKRGDKNALEPGLIASQLLPARKAYFRFNGSLTTPPCSEGVRWLVMKAPMQASKEQIERFAKAVGGRANNRPLQGVNARPVLR